MIKFFRKIRQTLLSENKFSKYFVYAIGEIILVVIGILLALYINNKNQAKIDQATLKGYLTSISNNIKDDADKINFLLNKRANTMSRVPYMYETVAKLDFLNKIDIKFASETLNTISKLEYLNTDASGFESVKNSGYLSKLQGKDIENLIYKYYNLVQEISKKEDDFNESLKNSISNFNSQTFEKKYFLSYPDYINGKNELTEIQPYLRKILFHSSTMTLYNQTFENTPELIVSYENLTIIGNEIVRMIDNNIQTFDSISRKNLSKIYNINSNIGYSKVLISGVSNNVFYELGLASPNNALLEISQGINEIRFNIPKLDWAAIYFRNPSNLQALKPTKDFSNYKSIRLEIKSNTDKGSVLFAIKDVDDPDDGSETKIPLTLSSEWNTYEIKLSEFKNADLKKLFLVACFIFTDSAQDISVRSIEYIK